MIRKTSVVIFLLLLLVGCTDKEVSTDSFVRDEELSTVDLSSANSEGSREYQQSFKIQSIESQVTSITINDSNLERSLEGVAYHVLLYTDQKIPADRNLSYEFEVVSNSNHISVLAPQSIKGLTFVRTTTDGYIYGLRFDTIYREYSQEELDNLKNFRDFQVFVKYEGRCYLIKQS